MKNQSLFSYSTLFSYFSKTIFFQRIRFDISLESSVLADDSNEISSLILLTDVSNEMFSLVFSKKIKTNRNVVCCTLDVDFYVKDEFFYANHDTPHLLKIIFGILCKLSPIVFPENRIEHSVQMVSFGVLQLS